MKTRRLGLTPSILASLTLLLLLTWILLSLISLKTAQKDLYAQKNEFARIQLASFLSLLPPNAGLEVAGTAVARYLDVLKGEPDFSGLLLVDRNNTVRFTQGESVAPDARLQETLTTGRGSFAFSGNGKYLHRYAPLVQDGEAVAAARLTYSLEHELQRLKHAQQIYLAYFMLDFLLLLGFGSFLLSRLIVSPLQRLLAATERIAAGDYSHRVHIGGGREIGELAVSFNTMLDNLKAKRDEVDRHLNALQESNRQLQIAREEAVRSAKLASVGVLSAGMAHEIGTPLASIMGYVEILKEELSGDTERSDYIRRIGDASVRIDRIVRGLLDYARPTPLMNEEVDVAELLDNTIRLLDEQGVFKRITAQVDCEAGLPHLHVDPHQLQQVLINLMINARDAMPDGGKVTLAASCGKLEAIHDLPSTPMARGRRKDDFGGVFLAPVDRGTPEMSCIRIEVADTGSGIPAEHLDKIFDPFFTTKEPGKGTGLGLAISARIVDSFRGRMTVESKAGEGSRFVIWLPLSAEDRKG